MKKLFLLAFIFLSVRTFAQLKAEDVKSFTLKNGMKFLVLEDYSIPNANMYVFYRVGSRNEHPGVTGLSHFFEHMMFNGAKKYGPKLFDQTMEFNGGANNAYTTEIIFKIFLCPVFDIRFITDDRPVVCTFLECCRLYIF